MKKIGANDLLPIIRVEDPKSIEFFERKEKHFISNKQLRNYAKNLFQRNLLDKAFIIYEYLVMKNSEELQVVYSNMGLIQQKKNNILQAKSFYERSLKIKKFQKSQIRLATIFLHLNQYSKAEKIICQIQNIQQKQKLQRQIIALKEKHGQSFNLNKIIKKKFKSTQCIRYSSIFLQLFQQVQRQTNPTHSINIRQQKDFFLIYKHYFEEQLGQKLKNQQAFIQTIENIYKATDNINLKKQEIGRFYKIVEACYKIWFGKEKYQYPYSFPYAISIHQGDINRYAKDISSIELGAQTVYYFSLRQNYIQKRLEDICLQLQQKKKFKQAEQIYRYSLNYCCPFNVKVAKLLFVQQKYDQNIKYCQQRIQIMLKFPIERFFKQISELIVQKLKSMIKLKKCKEALQNGQKYLSILEKLNPKNIFQNYNTRQKVFQGKQCVCRQSGFQFLRNIFKEVTRCLIYLKQYQKARQCLKQFIVKKQQCNYHQLIQFYYQTQLLDIAISRATDPKQAIKKVSLLLKQINKDKKLEDKQSYTKQLLKIKLQLHLHNYNISQIIKLCESIVHLNNINLILVKQKINAFICKLDLDFNNNNILQILKKVQESQQLRCLHLEMVHKAKDKFQQISRYGKNINNQSLKKIDEYITSILKFEVQEQLQIELEDQIEDTIIYSTKQDLSLNDKPENHTEKFILNYNNQITQDFEDEQADHYQNQICRFQGKNNILYIVIFQQKLIQSLQVSEYKKFVCVSDHFCKKQYGSTGIKIKGKELRLKIRYTARLIGQLIQHKQNRKVKFCYFTKRQNHDDYKRGKK